MVSRFVCEASFTVDSMLRRNPISLIQKKAANDTAKTTQYNAERRARIGRREVSSEPPRNIQTRDVFESASFAIRRPIFSATSG